jgi:hypothetical protein
MGPTTLLLLGIVASLQESRAAAPSPASRPASSPASSPASRPASGAAAVPKAISSKLAAILGKADADPAYAVKDLEGAVVSLGSPILPELETAFRARAAGPTGAPLARAFGRIAGIKAIPTFHAVGQSEDVNARESAVRGLGTISHKNALDELLVLLDDPRSPVEHAAQDAIVALEGVKPRIGVRGALERRLSARESTPTSRLRATQCLSRIADPDSARCLLTNLDDRDPDVRAACVEALGRIKAAAAESGEKLLARLEDADLEVRKQAILALGRLRVREACPTLIGLLEDEDHALQSNALWALRAISGHSFPSSAERWQEWWKREVAREKEAKEKAEEPAEKDP